MIRKRNLQNFLLHHLTTWGFITVLLFSLGIADSAAATVTLKSNDAAGTSSFTGSANWNPAGVPATGNGYFTGAHLIRSVNNTTTGTTNIFAGDFLSIDPGGRFLAKVGNNIAGNTTVACNTANYILNGGLMDQAGANSDSSVCVIDGTVTVTAASFLGALGAASSDNSHFETLDIIAPISGTAALQVSGANINSGDDTGVVKLSAANPYEGAITITNADNNVVASAVHRVLELNHLNALSNATLNLVATAVNPVSFSESVNSAAFNVGALSGTSLQTLSDTAGNAVTLSVGGNDSSSGYRGILTGPGNLVKTGAGTLILSGENAFSGVTTISNGVVALSGSGSLASSIGIVGPDALLDLSGLNGSSLRIAAGKSLSGNGLVNGSIAMSSASVLTPGDGAIGILTVSANLTLNNGSSNFFDLGVSAASLNDRVLVGGALSCNNSSIHINAVEGAANLDTSDYVLFYATNGIDGSCAATPVFSGTAPANASHYTVVSQGNAVMLRYNSHVPAASITTASPLSPTWGQSVFVRVTIAPGDGAVMGVTLDASAIGGSSSATMVLDSSTPNAWTNSVIVNAVAGAGSRTLTATVADENGLLSSSSVSLSVGPPAQAIQNPILPSHHADPYITCFSGKYWIYPTTEDTRSFRAFSSTNLIDWADEGEIFNLTKQSSWATTGYGWAPCVVHFNGSFYFYYAVGGAAGWQDSKIGVAVGPSPAGPFVDIGAPLVSIQTTSPRLEAIDPMFFIDSDGKAYLYYGGSAGANLGIRQLNTNTMTSFSAPLNVITPPGFTEAAFMSKRNGIYYISYSNGNWQNNTYNVRYATALSPLGPWTYKGQILAPDSLHKGPGSHAFLQVPDTDVWYICYHYWDSVYSTRHVALDSISYNPDGTIKPVAMTGGGLVGRWESHSLPGNYLVHTNGVGKLVDSEWTDETSQFLMVPGLAGDSTNTVSFELIDKPDRYLRRKSNGQIVMDLWTSGGTFNADATFFLRPGLADSADISFESYSSPGNYIRQVNSLVYCQAGSGSTFYSDATWKRWTASMLLDLRIAPASGSQAVVTWNPTWNGTGTLLEASDLNTAWVTNYSAVSPFYINPTHRARFFKIEP